MKKARRGDSPLRIGTALEIAKTRQVIVDICIGKRTHDGQWDVLILLEGELPRLGLRRSQLPMSELTNLLDNGKATILDD